jgi:hypothetical protein
MNEVADVSLSSSEHCNTPDVIVPGDKASVSRDGPNNLTIWSVLIFHEQVSVAWNNSS